MSASRIMQRLRRWLATASNTILGKLALAALAIVRRCDPDRSIERAARFMRWIGPWLPEHKVGRANLAAAFPEKSVTDIEAILREVWANLGRVGAEFVHLDRLWDQDPDDPTLGRIEFEPSASDRFLRIRDSGKPVLAFLAHYGNWELVAVGATAQGLRGAVVYRAPNIREIDHFVRKIRAANMGQLVKTTLDAPIRIANLLQSGVSVGMMVDQHYTRGIDVTFFGRRCKANPLIARLARQIECPIYGARGIRLPGNRFRIEITEAIEPARDADGRIDVAGTMQRITNVIEGWVREHPEQWLWLHRRWR